MLIETNTLSSTSTYDPYYGCYLDEHHLGTRLVNLLPVNHADVSRSVFKFLNWKDLGNCGKISRGWNLVTHHLFSIEKVEVYKKFFNAEDWSNFFEEISREKLTKIFRSFSPILEVDIESDYVMAWCPKKLSIIKFGLLLKKHFPNNETGYVKPDKVTDGDLEIIKKHGHVETKESSFIIAKRKELSKGIFQHNESHLALLKKLNSETAKEHEASSLLKMIVLLATAKLKFNIELYNHKSVRCQEDIYYSGRHCFNATRIDSDGIHISYLWSAMCPINYVAILKNKNSLKRKCEDDVESASVQSKKRKIEI